jgi:hypothetical protein
LRVYDQRRLAGERAIEHTTRTLDDAVRALDHRIEAELGDGVPRESRFS